RTRRSLRRLSVSSGLARWRPFMDCRQSRPHYGQGRAPGGLRRGEAAGTTATEAAGTDTTEAADTDTDATEAAARAPSRTRTLDQRLLHLQGETWRGLDREQQRADLQHHGSR